MPLSLSRESPRGPRGAAKGPHTIPETPLSQQPRRGPQSSGRILSPEESMKRSPDSMLPDSAIRISAYTEGSVASALEK